MEESHYSISVSNLICQEDASHLLDESDIFLPLQEEDFLILSATAEDDEYIETLVSKESSFESRTTDSSSENLTRCARSHYIHWILKMKVCFGFGYHTAYLAVTYIDRFFDRQTIETWNQEGKAWAMELLSVACLSLAAKMEECRPPALSEYDLEEYQFSSEVIQRMELFVLNTLEWRLCSVTPFAYLGYFVSKFQNEQEPMVLCSRAIRFIFAIIEATSLLEYRPSIVAASAILAAAGDHLTVKTVESKMRAISLPESLKTEHVFSCYSLMILESQKEKLKSSKLMVSSEASANFASVNDSIDVHSPITFSDTGNKRRRLESHQTQ